VQAPVYQLPNSLWGRVRPAATRAAVLTVRNNVNHPSIFTWSLANEPGGNRSELGVIGPDLERYIREASTAVRELDDTRLVAIDRQSRVEEPLTSPAYAYLDVLGVNEYFGWYDSYRADLQRPPTTLDELGPFLDAVHAANPDLPLVITEFGAEAKGPGPVEQRGTYEFQRQFVRDHLAVHASKRYVHGSIHWALRDFRVEPTWLGGAPPEWAVPPWHNKSLIEENNGRKPAYFEMRRRWRATNALR
jgi:Glycosyl hydrolases family 2, TIM barrel domain